MNETMEAGSHAITISAGQLPRVRWHVHRWCLVTVLAPHQRDGWLLAHARRQGRLGAAHQQRGHRHAIGQQSLRHQRASIIEQRKLLCRRRPTFPEPPRLAVGTARQGPARTRRTHRKHSAAQPLHPAHCSRILPPVASRSADSSSRSPSYCILWVVCDRPGSPELAF